MDPIANLREQLEIARAAVNFENAGFARLAELVLAMDEWRRHGGFDRSLTSEDDISDALVDLKGVCEDVGVDFWALVRGVQEGEAAANAEA